MFVQIFKTIAAKQYEEFQTTKLLEDCTCFKQEDHDGPGSLT